MRIQDPFKVSEVMEKGNRPSTIDKQFLLVVGSPRSGTTWLTRMLGLHPDVASVPHELTVLSRYLGTWVEGYEAEAEKHEQGRWHLGLPMIMDRKEFHDLLVELLHRIYARVLERNPTATHILDKHPRYTHYMPIIDGLLPQCRYVHIIRDGREVAVSMISANKRIGFGAGSIRGAAKDWYMGVTRAMEHGQRIGPGRYLEVRYEKLMQDPEPEFARILEFAGLETTADRVKEITSAFNVEEMQVSSGDRSLNAIRHIPGGIWKNKLSLTERYLFEKYVGDLLRQLGYTDKEDWWALNDRDRMKMRTFEVRYKIHASLRSLKEIWKTPVFRKVKS
jgi:hypothetical protein